VADAEAKSSSSPDETRTFDKGKVDLVKFSDGVVGLGQQAQMPVAPRSSARRVHSIELAVSVCAQGSQAPNTP
jgi:hypothetical protein